MKLIPAIDVKCNKVVRLYQGNFEQCTYYHDSPVEIATQYIQQGANELHLVDLDGAQQGKSVEKNWLADIARINRSVVLQIGGGIRSEEDIIHCLEQGASRVVMGSMALTDVKQVIQWLKYFGPEKIVLALDIKMNHEYLPMIVTHGWQHTSQSTLWELLVAYKGTSLKHVLCTDMGRDGTFIGSNDSLYRLCVNRYSMISWQASGGVSTIADLLRLKALGITRTIIGKALLEKRFTYEEAFAEVSPC